MTSRFLFVFAVAVVLCSAQMSSQGSVTASGSFSGSASFGPPPPFAMPAITGAPYSGEEVRESVQILADGNRITRKMPGNKTWRDNEGRTRTERPLGMAPMGQSQMTFPVIVEITDPVAGYKYTLDTQNKVAHRQTLPAPGTRPGFIGGTVGSGPIGGMVRSGTMQASIPPASIPPASIPPQSIPPQSIPPQSIPPQSIPPGEGGGSRVAAARGGAGPAQGVAPAAPPGQPRVVREPLGTRSFDGVMAEGTRTTMSYPVGMMGNDREFTAVSETWMSPELKIQVYSKNDDPRSGENTFRIENLSRTPPDPLLFMPPSDYKVVDEAGGFTIQYKGQ